MQNKAVQTEMFLDVEVRHQRFMGVITIIMFHTKTVPGIVQWDSYEVYLKFETKSLSDKKSTLECREWLPLRQMERIIGIFFEQLFLFTETNEYLKVEV